ncbi:MAG: hypothetical protein JKY54_01740, partial [Flavobacteriales bacterium]|nr:hypothetical protein [Flavobacteriales bacterium]
MLLEKRFSLFPLAEIGDLDNSLLITKSNVNSPNLRDLKETYLGMRTNIFLSEDCGKLSVFHIGDEWAPYLKTMKEFGAFNDYSGSIDELSIALQTHKIMKTIQQPNGVNIGQSGVTILADSTGTRISKAPDHLLRLYNYNQILAAIGPHYFQAENYTEGKLIDWAEQAHVCSPISSMLVLESIADYDRFNIEENKNSLNNAAVSSSGAVP